MYFDCCLTHVSWKLCCSAGATEMSKIVLYNLEKKKGKVGGVGHRQG